MSNTARIRSGLVLVALAALCALPAAAAAAAKERRAFHPTPGVVTPPPPGAPPLTDRILDRDELAPVARRATENRYLTPNGEVVFVAASDLYLPDPVGDQALVNFLASLEHGKELNGFKVYIAHPLEMSELCGPQAAACYHPGHERMFVVGEPKFGGLPTDYVAAHEYGHHVANHRSNPPFPGSALYWGTKRWASHQKVCPGTAAGKLHPGNQGRHYFENPGEAFAEEYALHHFPRLLPWEYTAFLKPSRASTAQLVTDVRRPWVKNRKSKHTARVSRRKSAKITVRTPLDGSLKVTMKGPRRSDFDLTLRHRNRVVERSAGPGSREALRYLVCGESKFRLSVNASEGSGRAKLSVSRP